MSIIVVISYIVAGSAHHKGIAPFFVGIAMAVAGVTIGPMTGGFLNPWRALVPEIFAGVWANWWVWLVGPITGSIVGVGIVWLVSLVRNFYTDVDTIFATSTESAVRTTIHRE